MIILIDMDDTIEQLVIGWVEYVNKRFGTCAAPSDVRSWDMSLAFPGLTREQVYSVLDCDDLWDHVNPIPGAREAMEELLRRGHELYVVTASQYTTLRAKLEKVLFRYFPFIDWQHVIIASNKHMIRGDILIDDGPHNLTGGTYRKILYSANHNRSFDETAVGAVRAENWDEVLRIITQIETELLWNA